MTESDQRVKKETCASFGGISLTGLKAERLPSPTQEVKTPILSAIPDAGFSVAWSVPAFSVIPDTKPIVPLESPKIRNDPSFDLARFLVQKEDVAEPGPMLAPLEQASIEVQLIKEEGEASEEGECSEGMCPE